MSENLLNLVRQKARLVLEQVSRRVADRKLFEQIKRRLLDGEDLTDELPELKPHSKDDALDVADKLIQRCVADVADYWKYPNSPSIEVTVEQEQISTELIPRFRVGYEFKTGLGSVGLKVTTMGQNIYIEPLLDNIKTNLRDMAMQEVSQQLVMAGLRA